MTGIKYDKDTDSNISYSEEVLVVDGNDVTKSNLHKTFASIDTIEAEVTFRLTANEKDVDGYNHTFAAPPDDLYFFAVGSNALNNETIRDTLLKVLDKYLLGERKDSDRKSYPNVDGNAGDELVTILEGSTASLETYPIRVISEHYIGSPNISNIYDGSWDTDSFTMTLDMYEGSGAWAYFILVKHEDGAGYTIHCLNNLDNFDLPTRHTFEY